MKRIAILEEEKRAADKILAEEYSKKLDNEEKYYAEKRRVLEEAVDEIQRDIIFGKAGDGERSESNATKFTA